MMDSITLKITPSIVPKEIIRRSESFSGYQVKSRLNNLMLTSKDEFAILKGSLPKYMTGSNIETLKYCDLSATIRKLENDLQCDIANAQILGIEWSTTIETDFTPQTYYSVLGETWPFQRIPFKNSLYYDNPQRKALFYDKGKEAKVSGNHFRYELRLPKAKNLGYTLNSLTHPENYNRLTKDWLDLYLSLNKIRKLMPKEVKTQKDLTRFFESVAIETLGGKDQVLEMINNLHRQGKIKDYNRTRMRQSVNDLINNIGEETELETELNEKFRSVAKQNTIPLYSRGGGEC